MAQPSAVIFDLDQTLVDSTAALSLRSRRRWQQVYGLIPEFTLYDRIAELLETVQRQSLRVAIVTAAPTPYTTRVLRHFDIRSDVRVCYHDTQQHKPHPAPISLALERLGLDASQAISVGDHAKDIVASRAASVFAVAAAWGSDSPDDLRNADADHWCDTVDELTAFLTAT